MRFGGILAIAALLLGACNGDPEPKEPTATPTPSRPSPTATPPEMPDQAADEGAAGVSSFVNYWVQTRNYAAVTGDVSLLRAASDPECEGCNEYITVIEETYSRGGYFTGGGWSLGRVDVSAYAEDIVLRAEATIADSTFKTDSSETEQPGEGEKLEIGFATSPQPPYLMQQVFLGENS